MKKEKRNLLINFIKLFLTGVIFFVIFKKISFDSLLNVFYNARLVYLVLAFILSICFTFLKIFKWFILINSIDETNFSKAVDSYLIGMSLGIITPGRIGELARIVNLGSKLEGVGVALWDKILDLYAVLALSIFGIFYFTGFFWGILFLFILFVLLYLVINPEYLYVLNKLPIFNRYPQIINNLRMIKKRVLWVNLLITFFAYFVVILEGYILARAFGAGDFKALLYGYPLVMLVNLIPITVAGLGVREGTAIYLLSRLNVPANIAFNISFLVFIFNTALPALWGVISLYLEEIKKSIYKTNIWIYLSMFVGGFLRFYKIGVRSIWLDEAITAQVSSQNIWDIILNRASTGIHPPLYFISMHFWIKLFGDSEVSIRSFSAIFGVLCIYLIYKIASKIFDKTTGIISSFLFSLSPFYIYFGQEARMYPMVTFFVLLSILSLLKGIENRKNLILLTVSNILALYTHIFSAFVVLAQNLYILLTSFKNKKLLKKWIICQFIILIFISPWLYVIIQNKTPEVYQGARKVSLSSLAYIFLELNLGAGRAVFNNKVLVALFFVILFILGILPPWEKRKEFLFLFLYIFLPIFLLLIFSIKKSFFSARYISIFIPGYFIILGRGIKRLKHYSIILLFFLGIISIYILSLGYYYTNLSNLNRPWREAVSYLHQNIDKDEKVFIFAPYMWRPFEYYNRGKVKYETITLYKMDVFYNNLNKGEKFWLILANYDVEDPEGKLLKFVNDKFILIDEVSYFRLIIKYLKVPEV